MAQTGEGKERYSMYHVNTAILRETSLKKEPAQEETSSLGEAERNKSKEME